MKLKKLFAVLVSVAMIAALLPMMTFTASASVVRFYLPEGTYALSGALTERSVASDFRAGEIGEGTAGGNEAMPSLNWLDIVREAEEINDIGKGELLTIKFDYEFIFEVEYCEHDCTHIDGKWSANPANSDPCPHPGHEDFQNIPGSTSAKVNEHMAAMAECEHVHNAYYSIIFNYNTDCGTIPHSGWPFKVEEAKSSSTKGTFSQDLTEYFDDSISNLQWIGAMDIGIQITSTRGEGLAGKSIPATLIITNAFIEYRDSSTPAATCTPCTTAGCGKCVDANCTAEGHDPCPGHNACIPCAVSGCGKCIVTNCTVAGHDPCPGHGGTNNNNNNEDPPYVPPAADVDDDEVIDIIKKAIEADEVPVIVVADLGGTVISAELLLEIKELGADVKIELENGFSFLIKADTISDDVTNFDLNIDVDFTEEETTIGNAVIPVGSIVITPSFKGDFGFEIEMTLTAEQLEEAGIDVENVKLWYISGTTVTELDVIVVNDDGSITISFSSASFYVLSAEAPEMLELVVSTPVATPDVGDIPIVPITDGGTDTVTNVPVNDGGGGAVSAPSGGGDGNPGTGVAGVGLAAMFLSAGAAIIARRKK